jgi:hypothetical protein
MKLRLPMEPDVDIRQLALDTAKEADLPANLARAFGRRATEDEIDIAERWWNEWQGQPPVG